MLLHYLVNALSALCTWSHWPSAPISTRLYSAEPVASKYPIFKPSWLQDLGYHAKSCLYQTKICSVDERRVIDIWCSLEQSTIKMAFDHWRRRLRACIHSKERPFEHNLWTGDINFVSICHFQCNFVWMLPCYIFHSKICLQHVDNYVYKCVCFKR